jgi:hypothetical protein
MFLDTDLEIEEAMDDLDEEETQMRKYQHASIRSELVRRLFSEEDQDHTVEEDQDPV